MRKSILSFKLLLFSYVMLSAAPNPFRHQLVESYVEKYSRIAVIESMRSGIPASIKLAQGLLESGYGQGNLALMSNNHFGIKWHSAADGDFVEAFDDEFDKKGRKIHSKFVKFNSPEESYQQHTVFLMTRPNYRLLFTFDRTDYRSWALGLQKAHYATNPKYAELLIALIKQYQLDLFDIPTQLSLDDTPQYVQLQPGYNKFAQQPVKPESSDPFPSHKKENVKKEVVAANQPTKFMELKKEENTEGEEEHILFEVTATALASKSVKVLKSPVPRRQKR